MGKSVDFYKITNESECHNGLQYHDGLIEDFMPFNPSGYCDGGGIYFTREDILSFIPNGCWLRRVTLPEGEEICLNYGRPVTWKAHRVILGTRERVTASVIKRLYEEGAHDPIDGRAIMEVAASGNKDAVNLFLDLKVPINEDAMTLAADYGHEDVVRLLLRRNAPIDTNAIMFAAEDGNKEIVALLLAHNAPVNAGAVEGAAKNGHEEVVALLLSHNAPIRPEAIEAAAESGHAAIVEMLKRNIMNNTDQ